MLFKKTDRQTNYIHSNIKNQGHKMGNQKTIGLVLFAVGLILLYFGWQSSESVGDRISETLTGRFTDETMLFLIGGVVGVVAGGVMAFRKSVSR